MCFWTGLAVGVVVGIGWYLWVTDFYDRPKAFYPTPVNGQRSR